MENHLNYAHCSSNNIFIYFEKIFFLVSHSEAYTVYFLKKHPPSFLMKIIFYSRKKSLFYSFVEFEKINKPKKNLRVKKKFKFWCPISHFFPQGGWWNIHRMKTKNLKDYLYKSIIFCSCVIPLNFWTRQRSLISHKCAPWLAMFNSA